MAKFKVGDRVKSVKTGREGTLLSMVRGQDALADKLGTLWNVKFDNGTEGMLREGTELTLANSCRSTNAVVAKALNATRVARNGSIMFELAKKYIEKNDDFGGVIDILKEDDNLMPNYAPSLWSSAMAKAKRYYDAGNKATPEQKKELVSMLSRLIANSRTSSNACGTARNAMDVTEQRKILAEAPKIEQAAKAITDRYKAISREVGALIPKYKELETKRIKLRQEKERVSAERFDFFRSLGKLREAGNIGLADKLYDMMDKAADDLSKVNMSYGAFGLL